MAARSIRLVPCLPLVMCLLAAPAAAGGGPTREELRDASSGIDWPLPGQDYAGQRYSRLDQIDRSNAAQLRPVCTFEIGDSSRFNAAPLVYKGVMYVSSGDSTVAIDAATCTQRWRHEASPTGSPRRVSNAFRSGGVAIQEGRLVRATSDSRLIALDLENGRQIWQRTIASAARYEFVIMAPIVFDDLVIAGIGVGEYGVKGWIGAFRVSDGEPVWHFDTVAEPGTPGADTWSSERSDAQRGGGGVWATPVLDVVSGALHVPVGNPVPDFHGDEREGTNLYTGTMIVLDVHSGKLLWHAQVVPHDLHDWDVTAAGPLYVAAGSTESPQRVAVGGKDGLLRSFDRRTGRQVFETAVTTRTNVDAVPTNAGVRACPGVLGGMQWSAPAFNPGLGSLFTVAVDWCGTYTKAAELRHVQGQLFLGGRFSFDPVAQARGWLTAVDADNGAVRWKYPSTRPMLAAVTTTASGLVVTGELGGDFIVLDGRDGRVLYRFDTGAPSAAGVVSYAVNGRQYLALASGTVTSFWQAPSTSSRVMVFSLPDGADKSSTQSTR